MKWPKNLRFSAAVERSIMTPHDHEDGARLTYEEKKLVGLGHNEETTYLFARHDEEPVEELARRGVDDAVAFRALRAALVEGREP